MSGKLDQSLDQIMTDRKTTNPKPRRTARPTRGAAQRAKAAIANPTGGVQKNTKAPKNAPKAPAGAGQNSGESKIIVSNLPEDVSETLIKDFFGKAIGGVKRVLIAYGPNGRSRGEATVTFNKPDSAASAQKQYNTVKVDGRAMRIELVGVAATKSLQDRMAKPKNAAKENAKGAVAGGKKGGPKPAATVNGDKKGKPKQKSGRAGKAKPKTTEELDAEMQDYFGGDNAANGAAAPNGAAQPAAATADTGMEDEVL